MNEATARVEKSKRMYEYGSCTLVITSYVYLEKALTRTVAMIISRLKAYGGRWKEWVRNTDFQKEARIVPMKHQNKRITQDPDGPYHIHDELLKAAKQMNLM